MSGNSVMRARPTTEKLDPHLGSALANGVVPEEEEAGTQSQIAKVLI